MSSTPPRTALFPGSFDPVTLGHLDVIARAAPLFDRLVVAVIHNPGKQALLGVDERLELLKGELQGQRTVEVIAFEGLTVAAAASVGARWIVRGVRSGSDLDYELPMAHTNRLAAAPPIETVFVPASPEVGHISSTLVRQIAQGGGRLEPFVTAAVARALLRKLGR